MNLFDRSLAIFILTMLGSIWFFTGAIFLALEAPKALAKQEMYKQKTGKDISFLSALGMPFEACIPSEPDKTLNINLGKAEKEK